MDQLRFRFGLDDGVSGPAKGIKTGLEGLKKAFGDLGAASKDSASAMEGHFKALGEFNEKLNFSIELFKKLAEPVMMLGEKVFDLGKEFSKATLESAEFAERSHIAFTAMLGSGKAADDVMKSIVNTAATLPITTQSAFGYATSLITGGFKGGDLKTLLTAVSDIGALNPANQAGAQEELVANLRRIKGEGFLDERSLRTLAGIGINEGTLSAKIAQALGLNLTQVRDAVAKRKVTVDVGISAILDTIRQTEGGKLGNLSNKLAETSSGLISTIKSRFFEATMDLGKGGGMEAFTGFLKNVRDLTNQTSESGMKLKSVIGDTFNAIFEGMFGKLSGAGGKTQLLAIFDEIMSVAQQLPAVISAVFGDIEQLLAGFFGSDSAHGWRDLFDPAAIKALGPAFHDIGASLSTAAGFAMDIARAIGPVLKILGYGAAIGGGAAGGFETGALVGSIFGPLGTAVGSAAGAVLGGLGGLYGATKVEDGLSPDDLPHHAAGGITTGGHAAVVGEAGPELIMPLPAGGLSAFGGGNRSMHVGEIHVHVGGEHGGSDQSMKEQVREGTMLALQQILETMNLEAGGGVA